MRIVYLVHDLADPSVARRVRMLLTGGAEVVLCGFHRTAEPPGDVCGVRSIPLGRTADARFAQRALAVTSSIVRAGAIARRVGPVDAILARNLECLPLAQALRSRQRTPPRVVYEVLDIHRLLLGDTVLAARLRSTEARLAQSADLLLTSSPAFLREYFEPRSGLRIPATVVENKVFDSREEAGPTPPAGPPFRIGLFGALRCRRSVDLLQGLARDLDGRVEFVLAGRPSTAVFDQLEDEIAGCAHGTFLGRYRNPEDLPTLYGQVHFAFAVDYFESGGNSEWLLPNRLYEAAAFGAVPLARSGTETARLLESLGCGVILDGNDIESALARYFWTLDAATYAHERARVRRIPRSRFVVDEHECRRLVGSIMGMSVPANSLERAA